MAAALADPAEAQSHLENARLTDPLSPDPPIALAAHLCSQSEASRAPGESGLLEQYCAIALRLSPKSASIRHHCANLLYRAGQLTGQQEQVEMALDAYRRAVSLYPTNCRYRADLSGVLEETGDIAGARREAAEALRLDELTPHTDKKLPEEQREQMSRTILLSR